MPLERIKVEEPTMRMIYFHQYHTKFRARRKAIQSRELRERFMREVRNNVALRLQDTDAADQILLARPRRIAVWNYY